MPELNTNLDKQPVKQKKVWIKPEVEIIHEIESGSNTSHMEASYTINNKAHKLFS